MGNYVDDTYADAYIGVNPLVSTKWAGYTTAQKDNYIDYSEQQIDAMVWIGDKLVSTQVESFPRDLTTLKTYAQYNFVSAENQARYDEFDGLLPVVLQNAVCEYIIYIIRTQCFDDFVAMGESRLDRWKSGGMEREMDLTQILSDMPPQKVRQLLGFMTNSGFERLSVRLLERA